MKHQDSRAGFALPAAIGAVVIIGVLVASGFFMAQQEMRMGVATENAGMAFYVAERGASEVMDNWDNSVMETKTLFTDVTTFTGTTDQGDWEVDVRRIGTQLYFLDAVGQITQGGPLLSGAEHRVGIIARHLDLGIEPPAAVTARGGISFKGSPPELIGDDMPPSGWNSVCSGPPEDQIGFLSTDTTGTIDPGTSTKGAPYCDDYIYGDPCVEEDVPLVDETLEPFYEPEYWDYLIDIADHVWSTSPPSFGPSYVGGECDIDDPQNWGEIDDPTDPCGEYFPIIYFNTSVTLSGTGEGQGIMLVDGDLDWGGFGRYVGIVIVKGAFTSGGSPVITGALIAESINVINGTPTIQYSNCGVERAVELSKNLTRARPLSRRGFVDLSALN